MEGKPGKPERDHGGQLVSRCIDDLRATIFVVVLDHKFSPFKLIRKLPGDSFEFVERIGFELAVDLKTHDEGFLTVFSALRGDREKDFCVIFIIRGRGLFGSHAGSRCPSIVSQNPGSALSSSATSYE